jgi:hypothetical protein
MPPKPRRPAETLALYLSPLRDDECWVFQGPLTGGGYGIVWERVSGKSRNRGAHRVSWEVANGPIPDGMQVLHRCDNPPCCNPSHLFLGSARDNLLDMSQKGRHFSRTKPERVARGERNGQHTHPERTARGERTSSHKVTAEQVKAIRQRLAIGESGRALARAYRVDKKTIYRIRDGMSWSWL